MEQAGLLIAMLVSVFIGAFLMYLYMSVYYEIKQHNSKLQKIIDTYREHMKKMGITDEETIQDIIRGKSFDEIELLNRRLSKIKYYEDENKERNNRNRF